MPNKQRQKWKIEYKCNISGWLLFIVCALLYLAAGLKSGDILTILGSIAFLIACLVFLLPYLYKPQAQDDNNK